MAIKYYHDLEQNTEEWVKIRTGLLTASEMKLIITPAKLQYAQNDKEKTHVNEIAAQRINNYVEPTYQSDEMLKGNWNEYEMREIYSKHYAPVKQCGFITNDKWGFTLGYSPDGLVGDDGCIEGKSRRQKYQVETIVGGKVPDEYVIQLQTGLLVSERKWIDFISYCGGMALYVQRVFPDEKVQEAIIAAATTFHQRLDTVLALYKENSAGFFMTERIIEKEMFV